ncbi:MAG: hypothetical protein K2M12_06305, partial [Muribaculaceae bacterium]|nr:hypothetical protein [Muribaculaceae bacterium]
SMQDTVVENAAQTAYVPPVAAAEDNPLEQSAGQYGHEQPEADSRVATSRCRHNVLLNYEDGYSAPLCYIYFNDKGEIFYSKNDFYFDAEAGCRGALVVNPDEKAGYLVMCFNGAYVAKVPLREIFEKPENTPFRYWSGEPLQFVTIGRAGDGIMCVMTDNGGALNARCTPLADIPECRLTAQPAKLLDLPVPSVHSCELVASSALGQLDKYMAAKLGARKLGTALRVHPAPDEAAADLERFYEQCKPLI